MSFSDILYFLMSIVRRFWYIFLVIALYFIFRLIIVHVADMKMKNEGYEFIVYAREWYRTPEEQGGRGDQPFVMSAIHPREPQPEGKVSADIAKYIVERTDTEIFGGSSFINSSGRYIFRNVEDKPTFTDFEGSKMNIYLGYWVKFSVEFDLATDDDVKIETEIRKTLHLSRSPFRRIANSPR